MSRPTQQRDSAGATSTKWLVALVVWIAVIWGHSLLAGPESAGESGLVVALLRPLFGLVGLTDPDLMSLVVRKCAHFTEYAILAALVANNCRAQGWRRWRAGLAHLAFVAIPLVDELVIQARVPGRSGNLTDVCIDCAGMATGAILAWLTMRYHEKRRA